MIPKRGEIRILPCNPGCLLMLHNGVDRGSQFEFYVLWKPHKKLSSWNNGEPLILLLTLGLGRSISKLNKRWQRWEGHKFESMKWFAVEK